MPERPRVSVIVTAYNLAGYLPAALDSALAQESPGGPVQVIVVDDGSTDDTPQVLAGYAGRVEVIRQPNGGLVAAVDRGLQAVRGEYVALLDADDEWPRDRLRRHVEILERSPLVGLVHGDMEVIDAGGATIHPSFFAWKRETRTDGRVLPLLIKDNFVSGGASTFRASLLPAIRPIGAEAAYPDWWIATSVAAVAEIASDPGIANRYRYHGSNMGLGADHRRQLEIERRELPFRRWMMRNLIGDETITLKQLSEIVIRWRHALMYAGASAGGSVRGVVATEPTAAAAELAVAAAQPIGMERCRTLARALSRDPYDGATSADLDIAIMQASAAQPGQSPAAPPLIAVPARPRLTLAWLDELLSRPALLAAYGQRWGQDAEATLAVLAPAGANLEPLVALVAADPLLDDERCDIQVLSEPATTPARNLLAARACALLTVREPVAPFTELARHGATEQAERGSDSAPPLAA